MCGTFTKDNIRPRDLYCIALLLSDLPLRWSFSAGVITLNIPHMLPWWSSESWRKWVLLSVSDSSSNWDILQWQFDSCLFQIFIFHLMKWWLLFPMQNMVRCHSWLSFRLSFPRKNVNHSFLSACSESLPHRYVSYSFLQNNVNCVFRCCCVTGSQNGGRSGFTRLWESGDADRNCLLRFRFRQHQLQQFCGTRWKSG